MWAEAPSEDATTSQTLRCLLHETNELKQWEIVLPTIEMVINSLPNSSTGFSPFYLNYGHEPVMPVQLLEGNEKIQYRECGFLHPKDHI